MTISSDKLDIVSFTTFLAILTALVSVFASLVYQRYPIPVVLEPRIFPASADGGPAEERTPLLVPADPNQGITTTGQPKYPATIIDLIKTVDFWLLAVFCVFILGAVNKIQLNSNYVCTYPLSDSLKWSSQTLALSPRPFPLLHTS